jgi:hypothetical protein
MSAFQDTNTTTIGTKGSDVYTATGVNDPRVALSVLLTRGVAAASVADGVNAIVKMGTINAILKSGTMDNHNPVEDAFLLAFQTRDVRGGKGERDASEEVWKALLANYATSAAAKRMLHLIPEYGSWRDLFQLAEDVPAVREEVLCLALEQLTKDTEAMVNGKSVSLLAKWIPREDRQKSLAQALAKTLYPELVYSSQMKNYRKAVAALNKHLQTVEIKMCGKTWADIKPGAVPGRAGKKYAKAFLNEPVERKGRPRRASYASEALRYPGDEDRMKCRENFLEYNRKTASGEVKAKGADTLFPHEVIKKVYQTRRRGPGDFLDGAEGTDGEKDHLRGVWKAMVEAARTGGGLGRSLAMCDFSGSMQSAGRQGDLPYWVSMAMGLLISECTTEEFKNRVLTFDSKPQYFTYPETDDVFAKIEALQRAGGIGQGTSTDFQAAMDLVLKTLKEKRVRPGQEPENLIVITDMNWDQASSSSQYGYYTGNSYRHHTKTAPWQTHVEMIRESFKRAGEDMWGEGQGLKMPRIVIWNVAATSADFHAQSDTEGVVMLAGWSPHLFKVLQSQGVVVQTPYAALRAQLDDPRYDAVRTAFRGLTKEA